jgi:hypothetical protein
MTQSVYKKWAELLRTGSASTFFESYPDDAELAAKISEFFKATDPIRVEDIRRDRQRYFARPVFGEIINEEEASPTKNVIRNKAQQLNLEQALAEILDNIFDNFQRNAPHDLSVEITAYPQTEASPGEIWITENSGGIEKKRIVPLIQLGFSERSARGIGAWGEGFKMAVFALGEEVEVISYYPGESPVGIRFPRGWLDPKSTLWNKWKVNTYKIDKNAPPVGTTSIRINYVNPQILESLGLSSMSKRTAEQVCDDLAEYFGEVYAEKYHYLTAKAYGNITITITIGMTTRQVQFKERVRDRLIQNFAFIPWLLPIHWNLTWEVEVEEPSDESKSRVAKLNVEIFAGIAATFSYSKLYSPQLPGVEMWGNGRLFSLKGKIADESVGWGYKFGGSGGTNPESNASSRRMTIVALFTSEDSRDIPWAAPVKNDYNRRSEFYAEIRETFAKVIRLYKDVLRFLEPRILIFSSEWTKRSDQEKLNLLFDGSDATSEFKQRFAESRFGSKLLAYKPTFSFREISDKDIEVNVSKIFNVSTTNIQEIVLAASQTKNSASQVEEFLKAMFPKFNKEAEFEEIIGLANDEELKL